jgi:hypothetical protein
LLFVRAGIENRHNITGMHRLALLKVHGLQRACYLRPDGDEAAVDLTESHDENSIR